MTYHDHPCWLSVCTKYGSENQRVIDTIYILNNMDNARR